MDSVFLCACLFSRLQVGIQSADNAEATFSHFAAGLGCSDFGTLEKEQKSAVLMFPGLQNQQVPVCTCEGKYQARYFI